jgi:hypothetical protein
VLFGGCDQQPQAQVVATLRTGAVAQVGLVGASAAAEQR